ncbi:NAD(P)/FAD-dependent oxidoreductase [Hathewaya massiliensis]|uniref:NAD(P)/FAD-dependent oxidoreductase n=1 Tax=Hathewaya massiliensis TaxID=1964382 RepID=UPI00115AA6EC|nr:FAD-dependent oxidoreductase [Hathewaya massiliensis]
MYYDIVIIGGGVAGMAAAIEARKQGVSGILILDREKYLGGVLNQCIHNGFGRYVLKKEVTGPEYANIFVEEIKKLGIDYKLETTVLEIDKDRNILAVNGTDGIMEIKAKVIILAMGCREKSRGAAKISGSTFAGVFTAGMVQRLINLEGIMPGKKVVILGSGDLGLIMAKRLTIEGAEVKGVIEILPYCSGLEENYNQCLKNFNIPLKLQHTIIDIKGQERVDGVLIAKVDSNKRVIKGTEEFISCDTVILSVGLTPESELFKKLGISVNSVTGGAEIDESMQTNIAGVFAAGNIVHLHDYVDDVTKEGILSGRNAAKFVLDKLKSNKSLKVIPGKGVAYILPKKINLDNVEEVVQFKFRSSTEYKDVNIRFNFGEGFLEVYKSKIIPSRMEIINIDKEQLIKNISEGEISVDICES